MSYQNTLNTPGWNDCAPTTFSAPIVSHRGSPTVSSSTSESSLSVSDSSSLPTPPPPPPPSSSSSSGPQRTAAAKTATGTTTPTTKAPIIINQGATLDAVTALLAHTLSLNTRLPANELAHYRARLDKALPGLATEDHDNKTVHHLDLVFHALQLAQNAPDGPSEAKDLVVRYMMMHTGVSIWALPLRRIIESLDV